MEIDSEGVTLTSSERVFLMYKRKTRNFGTQYVESLCVMQREYGAAD